MKRFFLLLVAVFSLCASSQIKDTLTDVYDEYFLIEEGGTLMIKLKEVSILPKHKFKSRIDANYYYWFRQKVFKAYPYAVLASKRIDSLHNRLNKIKSKRKKRKYVKKVQEYLENELADQIKKMTRTEGRILIKLIHRQTGKTVFENIKDFRNGWKAFWYNTTANIFKLSLKDEFHPELSNEDYLIEDILQRAFIDENLEVHEPRLKVDSFVVIENKKGEVDVEKYKKMFAKQRKKQKRKKK